MNLTSSGVYIGPRTELPPEGEWVRLIRGAYFDLGALPTDMRSWEVRAAITQARAEAITLTRRSAGATPLFTGECALQLQGIDTWLSVPDLVAWRADAKGHHVRAQLEELAAGGTRVPACRYTTVESARLLDETLEIGKLQTVSPLEAAIDLCRIGHPLQSIMGLSGLLRAQTDFTAFDQSQPRQAAAALQQKALDVAEGLRSNNAKVTAVINACDPGVFGPGEAFLRWLMAAVLPPDQIVTQKEVLINGRWYYLDAAVIGSKCGFEFDGHGKVDLGADGKQRFVDRHNELTRAGWHLARFTTADLHRPLQALRRVIGHLEDCSIPHNRVDKAIWKPLPSGLLMPDRRY